MDPQDWVDLYGDQLYAYAFSRVQNRMVAEDLVQETFVAALSSSAAFEGRSSEKTWLTAILKNKIMDHFRELRRRQTTDQSRDPDGLLDYFFHENGENPSCLNQGERIASLKSEGGITMKIFIDSADLDEIQQGFAWGVVNGVTTNPSLLKQALEKRLKKGERVQLKDYITRILTVAGDAPVSLEVTEYTADGMIAQGIRLYEMFNPVEGNVYIKIPVNPAFKDEDPTHFDGIRAIRELTKAGIPVNTTLIFTPEQALLAAKAGAAFVSPFAGRIDDDLRKKADISFDKLAYFPAAGMDVETGKLEDNGIVSGVDLVKQCVQIIELYKLKAEVLAASLRNPRQVRETALAGAHMATLPFVVLEKMLKHHKTYEGMASFTADAVPEYAQS
jgi:transaldolase